MHRQVRVEQAEPVVTVEPAAPFLAAMAEVVASAQTVATVAAYP
jgi:hypothetical protein